MKIMFLIFLFAAFFALAAGSTTITTDITEVRLSVITSSTIRTDTPHTTLYPVSDTTATLIFSSFTTTEATVYTATIHTVRNVTTVSPDLKSTPTITTTPLVSVDARPTTAPDETQGPALGIGGILGICFGGFFAVTVTLYVIFLMWRRRKHEMADGRNFRSQPRQDQNWNGPRQPISSPLSTGNPAQVGPALPLPMRAEMSPLSSPKVPPPRPGRPASLTESIQESMRQTPIAMTRRRNELDYSESLATEDLRHRSMSPFPLTINKVGTLNQTRPDANNNAAAQLGPSYSQEVMDVSQQINDHSQTQGNYAAGYQAQRPVLPELAHLQRSTSALRRTDDIQLQDLDENDLRVREARRASANRLLVGESRPDSPSHYDFAQNRAARLLDEKRKRSGMTTPTPSSRLSQSSAGPPPNFPLPPDPPVRPQTNWGNFI